MIVVPWASRVYEFCTLSAVFVKAAWTPGLDYGLIVEFWTNAELYSRISYLS